MLQHPFRSSVPESKAILVALGRAQAVIEFELDGTILTANKNFLDTVGYSLAEIQGKHHSMFVDPVYGASQDYKDFWVRLRGGEHQVAQFKRFGKGGREIWIEASYNPVCGRDGKPFKVIKFATDVTKQKTEYADLIGQVTAINTSQAVIEFDLDGYIQSANQIFLNAMGYTLAEIQGQHHGMFAESAYRNSAEYREFWAKLKRGDFQAGQFKRVAKGGREVWIEASYNPIRDLNGKPFKVVKYATDITRQVELLTHLKTLIDKNFGEIEQVMGHATERAGMAAVAVHETSGNVQRMAASAEQMAASVREIADTMAKSKAATEAAHLQTSTADQATQRLAATSRSMEGIVDLIRNIAGQINLLALNATIEAARAGEAGKGFAVVASEVKSLARQASQATDQISQDIAGLQEVSKSVIGALSVIESSIGVVRDYVVGTAAAVEEQSAVTQDMSTNMQMTAAHVTAINDNMSGISDAIQNMACAVDTTKSAATVLTR